MQDFKEFTDAEGLVSIPTSDLHQPTVCKKFHQYKCITDNPAWQEEEDAAAAMASIANANAIETATAGFSTITLPLETPLRNTNSNNYSNNNNADLASVDSSDTYASCQTHPFTSAGDLTADFAGISCDLDDLDMDNFASNPFEKNLSVNNNFGETYASARSNVKRSASGDGALQSLGVTPTMDREQPSFQSLDSASAVHHRSSEVGLNELPLPKHRKTRFQAGSLNKLKSRTYEGTSSSPKKLSHDSLMETTGPGGACSTLPTTKKNRRASFMPSKSLASATKLINQHLFGIQNNAPKLKGIVAFHICSIFCVGAVFFRRLHQFFNFSS